MCCDVNFDGKTAIIEKLESFEDKILFKVKNFLYKDEKFKYITIHIYKIYTKNDKTRVKAKIVYHIKDRNNYYPNEAKFAFSLANNIVDRDIFIICKHEAIISLITNYLTCFLVKELSYLDSEFDFSKGIEELVMNTQLKCENIPLHIDNSLGIIFPEDTEITFLRS